VTEEATAPFWSVRPTCIGTPTYRMQNKADIDGLIGVFITVRSSLVLLTTFLITQSRIFLQGATSKRLGFARHILASLCWMSF